MYFFRCWCDDTDFLIFANLEFPTICGFLVTANSALCSSSLIKTIRNSIKFAGFILKMAIPECFRASQEIKTD